MDFLRNAMSPCLASVEKNVHVPLHFAFRSFMVHA